MIAATAAAESQHSSGYRVKFRRKEFIEIIRLVKPPRIYRRGKNHFFAADGFMTFCQECTDLDFAVPVVEAIEISNKPWQT